ncbi:MAG: GLPGLI family protein [Flavobacterium sp.]|nr:GLPGLI family protein [Flavobacterium sp.]
MKKIAFALIAVIATMQLHAQKDFQGMAVYESKTTAPDVKQFMGGREITPDMQKMIDERMKKMLEKTFILNFDKAASIYKEEEKLDAPGQGGMGGGNRMMMSFMGGGGTFYKNVKEKSYTVDREFMGKEFLVKDSLQHLDWKMDAETKQIGGYTCYKATAVVPVNPTDYRNMRPKKTEEKKDGDKKEAPKSDDRKTNFMDNFEMPKEVTVTAWYAPEIPVNQGPETYWGLPGLILEVNDGKTTILCSKIVLNAKEKAEIKAPKNGQVVSQKEYEKIVLDKTAEIKEMNQGRGNGGRRPIGGF